MAVTLLFDTQLVQIDTLELDASLSEAHNAKVTLTKHPVEQGAAITDHMVEEPETCTIEGVVSNNPLPGGEAPEHTTYTDHKGRTWDTYSAARQDPKRAGNAYQALLEMKSSGRLLTVVTAIRTYESMKLTNLDVPRSADSGQALRFSATFEQVRVVTNATALIKASTTRAQPVQDLSKKNPVDNRTKLKKLLSKNQGGVVQPITTVVYNGAKNLIFGEGQ